MPLSFHIVNFSFIAYCNCICIVTFGNIRCTDATILASTWKYKEIEHISRILYILYLEIYRRQQIFKYNNRIGGVIVSVLASSTLYRGFEHRSKEFALAASTMSTQY